MEPSIFSALWQQVVHQPASLLLILGLSVIAYLLEIWPRFNSRFVPIVCILLGAVAYPFFASRASVPPGFPYPFLVLVVNGLIVGFVAALVHTKLIVWAIGKIGSPTEANKGNEEGNSKT